MFTLENRNTYYPPAKIFLYHMNFLLCHISFKHEIVMEYSTVTLISLKLLQYFQIYRQCIVQEQTVILQCHKRKH